MVLNRTASRGQVTNSPSSCLYPLLKRQLLRHFEPIHLLTSFGITPGRTELTPAEVRERRSKTQWRKSLVI
jgi:hypothetical protein